MSHSRKNVKAQALSEYPEPRDNEGALLTALPWPFAFKLCLFLY